jgi:large subunit ribosomal protein L10
MDREQKTAVVKELAEELKDADAIFAVDYRGISVPQAAELRSGLLDADARFRIVKNRLTLRAADEAGTESLKEYLEGPTALTFVKGDAALAAKTIFRLGSEWELLTYKGGLMDGEALDPDSFVAIARLPGRDQLNAQFAGIIASPLTGLARGLGSMIQGLALQLGQIAEQGLVSGEAPAETPAQEAPAEQEEAPKEEEEAPKEVEAPAAAADTEGSDEEAGGGEEASADGEAESQPDPDPAASPEETSEEQAPEGEEAGQGEAEETGEGDQDLGDEQAAEDEADETSEEAEETSEDSDETKEKGN